MATVRDQVGKAVEAVRRGEYERIANGVRGKVAGVLTDVQRRKTLRDIEQFDNEWARKIADGCRMWTDDLFSPQQKRLFGAIESRKSVLENDDTEVTYSFHGPNDEGLTTDTYEGISKTVKISDFPHAPRRYGTLLTALASQFRSEQMLELGTCLGTSAAYIGAGLNDGHLVTVEAGEPQVEIARETLDELGLADRVTVRHARFQDVLLHDDKLPEFRLAFLDGHHQKDATLEYFDALAESVTANAVVVFDDVNGYSEGMTEAWTSICADSRVDLSVLTDRYGLVLLKSDISGENHFEFSR